MPLPDRDYRSSESQFRLRASEHGDGRQVIKMSCETLHLPSLAVTVRTCVPRSVQVYVAAGESGGEIVPALAVQETRGPQIAPSGCGQSASFADACSSMVRPTSVSRGATA
jgi:hypothetical protein